MWKSLKKSNQAPSEDGKKLDFLRISEKMLNFAVDYF